MSNDVTVDIINNLQNREFSYGIKENILPLLKDYKHRVEFVKHFAGLQDILYFEDVDAHFYDVPCFLNVKSESDDMEYDYVTQTIAHTFENAISDMGQIVNELHSFFENTNRTLYVEVGFIDNLLNNDDMWDVYNELPEYPDKDPIEVMFKKYNYPEWYVAEDGEKIVRIKKSIKILNDVQQLTVNKKINHLKQRIDTSLEIGDFNKAKTLNEELKKLCSNP